MKVLMTAEELEVKISKWKRNMTLTHEGINPLNHSNWLAQ
jgi:hypothetical protein